NVNTTALMTCGTWHRWEVVLKLNTVGSANGVFQWWIDGTQILNYSDVTYLTLGNTLGFYTFKFWPVWGGIGGSKTRDDYMQVDHLYISGKAGILGPLLTFPFAQGYAVDTTLTGGRLLGGGEIRRVTNLNDSGPGSLRAALATPGPADVVFEVGGVIRVNSEGTFPDTAFGLD